MKIKNILALGIIALVSGISTAQTYTATAGTNGTTDIQADYAQSTGDGASVSVDVPLEFELPKKVAIAVSPNEANTLPSLTEFAGIIPYYKSIAADVLDTRPYNATTFYNISKNSVRATGGIFANADVVVTYNGTDFIHESDPNSIIKSYDSFTLGGKDATTSTIRKLYGQTSDDMDSSTTAFPASISIDTANALTQENKATFHIIQYAYLDTIDPTDRAGKYISTATITISTL